MLTEAQQVVLRQGFCVIHMDQPRWVCSDMNYREWAGLIDMGAIRHKESRLHPDDDPGVCWERYIITEAGRFTVTIQYQNSLAYTVWAKSLDDAQDKAEQRFERKEPGAEITALRTEYSRAKEEA